ncbi:hypothetical protein ACC691_37925, partial [Rhizobium johnstonii]
PGLRDLAERVDGVSVPTSLIISSGPGDEEPRTTDLVERVHRLVAAADERVVLGIIGPPGSGKTTLAIALVEAFGDGAAWLPMDGFHLADSELERQGIRHRK